MRDRRAALPHSSESEFDELLSSRGPHLSLWCVSLQAMREAGKEPFPKFMTDSKNEGEVCLE